MASNSNFELETTTFVNGGRMDENGKRTIVMRSIYTIRDNSEAKRRRAVFDLADLVPQRGSCLKDDPRYVMKSAEWNCLDWKNQSVKFYINSTYERVSDENVTYPWELPPFNVSASTVEEAIAFKTAFDRNNEKDRKDNERNVDVVNSAGDPIEANTNEIFQQFSFSYYRQGFDVGNIQEFANSINQTEQRILGHNYPAGTLLIVDLSTDMLKTPATNDEDTEWTYTQINLTLRYNQNGWGRRLLDVGNRAIFGDSTKSELIYQYYAPIYDGSTVTFESSPTLTNAQGYYTANREYKVWLAEHEDAIGCPSQLPYEYGENIPLTEDGKIDYTLIEDGGKYPEIEFQEYPLKTWNTLSIPNQVRRRWR